MAVRDELPDTEQCRDHQPDAVTPATMRNPPFWMRRRYRVVMVVTLFLMLGISIAALLGLFKGARRVGVTVDLGYAQYRGLPAASGVDKWLGMRFAAPPVGELRFAAPQDPPIVAGVQDATNHGSRCISVGDQPPVERGSSEDCLYLDVYAPTGVTSESKLPVFFFIQGGGFSSNANANYDGSALIQASSNNILVVTFNYRVGPYGFLSGQEVDSLNNGLKDQRKALQWVKTHIEKFGGDPNHVVIGGDSAGAASVAFHLAAYNGRDDNLFHAAAAESPSFATVFNVSESQYIYDKFANATGCDQDGKSLSCMRSLSTDEIQKSNIRYAYRGAKGPAVFTWNPVIDGTLIQDYTYRSFNSGNFIKVPTIFGDDTNGGTIFTPRHLATLEDSNRFLANTFPYLDTDDFVKLNELYPGDTSISYPNTGPFWRRTADAYGEMRYMCPNLFLSSAFVTHAGQAGVKSWNYRYNVQDNAQMASGLGVPHTAELAAIWGPGNMAGDRAPMSYSHGQSNSAIIPMMQAYWTSFIRSYNPNTYRADGSPEWVSWSTGITLSNSTATDRENATIWAVDTTGTQDRILFDTPVSSSRMESVDDAQWARCEYLWSIGLDLRQ